MGNYLHQKILNSIEKISIYFYQGEIGINYATTNPKYNKQTYKL